MATGRFVRMDLVGAKTGSRWGGEQWQTGIGLVDGDAGGVFPNAVREGLPTFNAIADAENTSTTEFDISWSWRGTEKFSRSLQLSLAQAATAYCNGFKSFMAADSELVAVRISAVQASGKLVNGGNYFYLKTPIAGTQTAAVQMPPQLAIAVSHVTGARGAGGKGRMYLPLNGKASTYGKLTSVDQTALAAGAKAFLEELYSIGPVPAVISSAKLEYSAISRVRVGDVFDTQRRRREQVPEVYVDADLSYN